MIDTESLYIFNIELDELDIFVPFWFGEILGAGLMGVVIVL